MNIFILIFITIPILGFAICSWILRRNGRVYDFRIKLLNLIHSAAKERIYADKDDWKELYKLHDKYTYEQMLFSFKPLKLEAWFTKEEIESITPKE